MYYIIYFLWLKNSNWDFLAEKKVLYDINLLSLYNLHTFIIHRRNELLLTIILMFDILQKKIYRGNFKRVNILHSRNI